MVNINLDIDLRGQKVENREGRRKITCTVKQRAAPAGPPGRSVHRKATVLHIKLSLGLVRILPMTGKIKDGISMFPFFAMHSVSLGSRPSAGSRINIKVHLNGEFFMVLEIRYVHIT